MLPPLSGRPIRVNIRRSLGPYLASTSIRGRYILLDSEVLSTPGEFDRILVHEIFHFAWLRLSNDSRRCWEAVLEHELRLRLRGELGWSAEWRKSKLRLTDAVRRTPAWRRYACESFCDTAAWIFSGLRRHPEFTLPAEGRGLRRTWFTRTFPATIAIPI